VRPPIDDADIPAFWQALGLPGLWAAGFAARTPDCLHTSTFFPEPSATGYTAEAIEAGTRVFKAHVQVGGYDPH
jgi:hypothetical protein